MASLRLSNAHLKRKAARLVDRASGDDADAVPARYMSPRIGPEAERKARTLSHLFRATGGHLESGSSTQRHPGGSFGAATAGGKVGD